MTLLTCHVLDASAGTPAAGVAYTLRRDGEVLATGTTNADGRTDAPLLADAAPGRYVLEWEVGPYFADRPDLASTPYLDVVPIAFGVAAEQEHVHVALLVTPWSYTTYRGS